MLRDLNHPIETGSESRMEISDEGRKPLRVMTEADEQGPTSKAASVGGSLFGLGT